MLCDAFASVLKSGRAEFNQRFAEARQLYPALDQEGFTFFLSQSVDGLVREVDRIHRERVPETVMSAFDVTLDLVGQKLVGPGARHACIEDGWRRILPSAARIVALAPARILSAVANALHQLATTPAARPEQWISEMERVSSQCQEAETFLRLGQVCAWRAGLAHFREGALTLTDGLPEPLLSALFQLPPGQSWAETKKRMLVNPWIDPAGSQADALKIAAQAGAFRGFGGLFVEPPRVVASHQNFLVRSGGECWFLTADIFGATFHRALVDDFEAAKKETFAAPSLVRVEKNRIAYQGRTLDFPAFGAVSSHAANETTLALTFACTHSIALVLLQK